MWLGAIAVRECGGMPPAALSRMFGYTRVRGCHTLGVHGVSKEGGRLENETTAFFAQRMSVVTPGCLVDLTAP